MSPKDKSKPRFWRQYLGCHCYDQRTGLLKRSVAKRLGTSVDSLCGCPVGIYVGKRRAKIMARTFTVG